MAQRVEINATAPAFELTDLHGQTVRLEDYRGRKNLFLVFNRGLT